MQRQLVVEIATAYTIKISCYNLSNSFDSRSDRNCSKTSYLLSTKTNFILSKIDSI